MSIFISRHDLWQKLIEQRNKNKELEIGFHLNMGINQAVGIMNSLAAYDLPPCHNCGEQSEMSFMLEFARGQDYFYEVNRKQLRSLWTAYCIRHDYEPDTAEYDNDLRWIWQAMQENDSCPWHDDEDGILGFELFDVYMCEEVI